LESNWCKEMQDHLQLFLYLLKIEIHWGHYYKCTTQDAFCITYSSIVEILENSVWNCQTLFSKTNKYILSKEVPNISRMYIGRYGIGHQNKTCGWVT
jgi:hypothetical protein